MQEARTNRSAVVSLSLRVMQGVQRRAGKVWHSVVDPLTHPWRRHRARQHLSRFSGCRVLFMCYGNICRSPYAEARLANLLVDGRESHLVVTSAGFFGSGRPSTDIAREAAQERGLDLTTHRSLHFDEATVDDTLIVVMEPWQAGAARKKAQLPASRLLVLGDMDPLANAPRSIPDPYGGDKATFLDCYSRIDRCIAVLWAELNARHLTAEVE